MFFMYEIDNQKFGEFVAALEKKKVTHRRNWQKNCFFLIRRYQNGNVV